MSLDPGPEPEPRPAFVPAAELVAALRAARLVGDDQEAVRDEMLRFAYAHEDSLLRTCEAGHFTGSALVVDRGSRDILLLFHTKAQLWLQPGGHADGQAELAAVALREATEETGIEGLEVLGPAIDLDIHTFRPRTGPPHIHLDVRFVVLAPAGARTTGNHESEDMRWVPLDGLAAFGVDPGLARMASNGLRSVAAVLDR